MEWIFRISLIVIFSLFSIIRIQYQRIVQKAGYKTVIEESKKYSVFLSILICFEVFTLFLFLFLPELFSWSNLPLPIWLRWLGVFLAAAALTLFIWVHQHLGNNFSVKLRIKDTQKLIASGPYQWIRHPMYSAFYILHIASFLLIANWFIGITWITGLTLIIILRTDREEAMMIQAFGDDYRSYIDRTGKFTPSFRLQAIIKKKLS